MTGPNHADVPQLILEAGAKITHLLPDAATERLEASGVVLKDGIFYVIFDNTPHIGAISRLAPAADSRLIRPKSDDDAGYEDIAYDPVADRFFLLIEALPHHDQYLAKIREYDGGFKHSFTDWLPFPFDRPNKGLEGLTCLSRDGQTYLLALCEGNRCRAGTEGRKPGGGRVQVFRRGEHHWHHETSIHLPKTLWFEDYSSLAVTGDRIAVVSQSSAALWLGRLHPSDWAVAAEGTIYRFPADAEGGTAYCNVEGVAFLAADRIVVVSDKAKPEQPPGCRATDQSIHLFSIPPVSVAAGGTEAGVEADGAADR
jgi:hypothetical protein